MTRFDAAISAMESALTRPGPFRAWLRSRRWCGEGIAGSTEVAVKDRALLWSSDGEAIEWFLATAREGNLTVPLNLPFYFAFARPSPDAFELAGTPEPTYVVEAERQEGFARFLADGFHRQTTIRSAGEDILHFEGRDPGAFRSLGPAAETDSSNLLLPFATERHEIVYKSYKLLDVHNREPDIFARLEKKGFPHIPRYLGALALGKGDDRVVLGIATEYVEGTTDLFTWLTEQWSAELGLGGTSMPDFEDASLGLAAALGTATAELHQALVDRHPGPFAAEAFTGDDVEAATRFALGNLSDSLVRLATLAKAPDRTPAMRAAAARGMLFENRERIERTLEGLAAMEGTPKAVTHADLHLGQVLRTGDGRFLFVDFEGEPERAPGQRHGKLPPLRDVGTMNRSLSYVVHYAWRGYVHGDLSAALRLLTRDSLSSEETGVLDRLLRWERSVSERYAERYLAAAGSLYPEMNPDRAKRAIRAWMTEKALYELRYELKHRPENMFIPLEGLLSLATSTEP